MQGAIQEFKKGKLRRATRTDGILDLSQVSSNQIMVGVLKKSKEEGAVGQPISQRSAASLFKRGKKQRGGNFFKGDS